MITTAEQWARGLRGRLRDAQEQAEKALSSLKEAVASLDAQGRGEVCVPSKGARVRPVERMEGVERPRHVFMRKMGATRVEVDYTNVSVDCACLTCRKVYEVKLVGAFLVEEDRSRALWQVIEPSAESPFICRECRKRGGE